MGDYALISILTTLGGIISFAVIMLAVRAPGMKLSKKFASLGTLKGKSYQEISAVVGVSNSVAYRSDDYGNKIMIRQWLATGYHVVLLFDANDICLGVSDETTV